MSVLFVCKKRALVSLAILCLSASAAFSAQEILDGIAAVVNGDVITFSQVRELVGPREKQLHDQYKGKDLIDRIKEVRLAAVKDLVDRQLILQEFRKNKFSIPDYVIEDRIQTIIREEFGGDRGAFLRTLEAQGYTLSRFKEVEQEKIIVQAMRQKSVKTDLVIPPHKIEEYYEQNKEEFTTPDQVKLRMIVLKKDPSESAAKMKMADEIRAKVQAGAEFEKMAQMYSEDSTQETGGDWGWIDRHTLNESLTRVAFGLKPGQMSKVIEMGGNFYILYVEAKKNSTVKGFEQVRDDIEKKLLQTERQKLQQKWIDSLRQKAYIKSF